MCSTGATLCKITKHATVLFLVREEADLTLLCPPDQSYCMFLYFIKVLM